MHGGSTVTFQHVLGSSTWADKLLSESQSRMNMFCAAEGVFLGSFQTQTFSSCKSTERSMRILLLTVLSHPQTGTQTLAVTMTCSEELRLVFA